MTPPPAPPLSDELAVLQALAEAGAAFAGERTLAPVLDRLLASALHVARGDAGSIMLLSRTRDTLLVAAARGPRARLILGTSQPVDSSVAGWAIRAGQPVLLHGGAYARPVSTHPRDLASAAVAPLSVSGRLVGVLNVSREPGTSRMDDRSARLLELLARQAAILIDNAQMMEELRRKEARLEQLVDQLLQETGRQDSGRRASAEHTPRVPRVPLTPREQQVLELLVDGLTNREIGARLVVEPDTVKDYVQSIIKKLSAADRTHVAAIAVRAGLVS